MCVVVVCIFYEDFFIEIVDDFVCLDNGVVLKVEVCGVCWLDYYGWIGEYFCVKFGFIMGYEYCGIVVEVGLMV